MAITTADLTNYSLDAWIPTHEITRWDGDEITARYSVMALDADDDPGYIFYTWEEWQARNCAAFTADLDGAVRLHGELGPYSIRYAPGLAR